MRDSQKPPCQVPILESLPSSQSPEAEAKSYAGGLLWSIPTTDRARAQAPRRAGDSRGAGGVLPVYRRSRAAASCALGDSVTEIRVNRASCYIGAGNPIPVLLPPNRTAVASEVDKTLVGAADVMRAGAEARNQSAAQSPS